MQTVQMVLCLPACSSLASAAQLLCVCTITAPCACPGTCHTRNAQDPVRSIVAVTPAQQRSTRTPSVQILSGLVAGVAAVAVAPSQADNTAGFVDLFDDRKARQKGFDLIYEARDLDLVQNERDGLAQFRGDLKATKERYKEATKRISKDVGGYIDKMYWCASWHWHSLHTMFWTRSSALRAALQLVRPVLRVR